MARIPSLNCTASIFWARTSFQSLPLLPKTITAVVAEHVTARSFPRLLPPARRRIACLRPLHPVQTLRSRLFGLTAYRIVLK